jgi:hypothetical protein
MVTVNTSMGASQNNIVLGSGLSGMIAAYISARAQDDNATLNEDWRAQQAFRLTLPRWNRKNRPGGTGAALGS